MKNSTLIGSTICNLFNKRILRVEITTSIVLEGPAIYRNEGDLGALQTPCADSMIFPVPSSKAF